MAARPPVSEDVLRRAASLAENGAAAKIADRHGLRIQKICWEDNARNKDSCMGPRISAEGAGTSSLCELVSAT